MCLRRTIVREECSKLSLPPLKCNPTHSSQKSFFSLFLVKKLVCNFHRGISGENDCSHENDCLSLIEMCERTMPCHFTGGLDHGHICLGQKCPQTWPMRTMSDLYNMYFPSEDVY